MRLGLSQTMPASHAVFNGLYATSVPCTDECSGWFQVHFANWIGYCIDAASWRTGTDTGSVHWFWSHICLHGCKSNAALYNPMELGQCESDAREKWGLFIAAWPRAHWNNSSKPMSKALIHLFQSCWVFLWSVECWHIPFIVCISYFAIKWIDFFWFCWSVLWSFWQCIGRQCVPTKQLPSYLAWRKCSCKPL